MPVMLSVVGQELSGSFVFEQVNTDDDESVVRLVVVENWAAELDEGRR